MNNQNGDGGGPFGFRQQSTQRETLTGGMEGEFNIPILQSFASVVFACVGILFIWILVFVIGPDVLWCAGFAIIGVAARRVLLWIGTAQQDTQEQINGARAVTIGVCAAALVLFGAWAASRQFCVSIWPITPPTTSPWRIAFAASFIIIPIVICAFMAAHFLLEAYNPAVFQPHQAKPVGTPWWSPTGISIDETEPIDNEYPQARIVEVPRIVNRYDADNPNPNGNHLQKLLDDASERQHRIEPERVTDRFVAPGGRTVRVEDLNEFVLGSVEVGATFKTWHKRKGYSEEYWHALAETCAQQGIVTSPSPRSRTRLTVKTQREAAAALDSLWRHVFPPPHPAAKSVRGENEPDVRQTDTSSETEQN